MPPRQPPVPPPSHPRVRPGGGQHQQFHPAVPARIVVKHLQGSKNRLARELEDGRRTREGLTALEQDAAVLRASLEDRPDELAILERGLFALHYALEETERLRAMVMRMEQAVQIECVRWLNRKPPLLQLQTQPNGGSMAQEPPRRNGPLPAPPRKSNTRSDVYYDRAKAVEVPTDPKLLARMNAQPAGRPTRQPDRRAAVGYYEMGDEDPDTGERRGEWEGEGDAARPRRVYINAFNEPVPEPAPEVADRLPSIHGEPEMAESVPEEAAAAPASEGAPNPVPDAPAPPAQPPNGAA